MIERLKACVAEAHDLVNRVVEEAADPRGAHTRRFGFQIQHLSDQPCLPEEPAIEPRAVLAQPGFEFRDHSQGKGALAGDVLTAAEPGSPGACVALLKQEQRQVGGTARRRSPGKVPVGRVSQPVHSCGITRQQVQARNETVHPVNEQREMNGRFPWRNVPGHGAPALIAPHSRHDARQHRDEAVGRDRARAVERERAASLADDLARAWPTFVR